MAGISEPDGRAPVFDLEKLKTHVFEIGPIRPPSEGGSHSLLLRVTRNCPWSRCTFCYGQFYNRERFELRSVNEVKGDIDSIMSISNEISALSWRLGFTGMIAPLSESLPGILLGGREAKDLDRDEIKAVHCVINVYNWLAVGGETVFLQDADSLIMYTDWLVEIIRYLKEVFPNIARITSYARAKTVFKKRAEELEQLRRAGLTRLHIGLETGDDKLLKHVDKGVTSEEHIQAGKKALAAGFELSEYVMPGLGGRKMWEQHARNTASVLNQINPHFIRMRPFVPMAGTPMLEAYQTGEFELTSPHEHLRELRLLIENLEVTSRVSFDQVTNASYLMGNRLVPLMKPDYNGYKFPEEKGTVLELIDEGLRLSEQALLDVSIWAGTRGL